MQNRSRAALAAASVAMLVVPAGASAATKSVDMGTPASIAKTLQQKLNVDVNAYFPARTTIHVGDSVRFVPVGFHTVDLLKKGSGKVPAFVVPGALITGANDAANNPFWFNGKAGWGLNPALMKSGFGKKVSFSGAKAVSSGLPLANHPKPMTVKFTKAGRYSYFCSVHPGMKGSVTVLAKSKSIPSAKADRAALKRQEAATVRSAKGLGSTKAPANTVIVAPVAKTGAEFFGFVPSSLTVPVGTTVSFGMPSASTDEHTVSFGPGNPEREPKSYLGALSNSLNSPTFDQRAVYPSDAPGTTASLTPALHGNGFWNSGVMYGASRNLPFPAGGKVTFNQPGTYTFYCLIHAFMKGTVTVK